MFSKKWRKDTEDFALTELFHRYLQYLYDNYLNKCISARWMREGVLQEKLRLEPFVEQTLFTLLTKQSSVSIKDPYIFILQGDKGDGRRFFVRKMIEVCYTQIQHIIWSQAISDREFRFPVFACKNMVKDASLREGNINLVEFAIKCIIQQLQLSKNSEVELAGTLVKELGRRGKLALFFDENMFDGDTENVIQNRIESFVSRLEIQCITEVRPIAVFFGPRKFYIQDKEKCKKYFYIPIGPMTEFQIAQYLVAELPDHYHSFRETEIWLKEYEEAATILSKPERLLMYINYIRHEKSNSNNFTQIYKAEIMLSNIYSSYISAQIHQILTKPNCKVTQQKIESWLTAFAKGEIYQNDENIRSYFDACDMFSNGTNQFRFEGCKYYLIAKYYFDFEHKSKRQIKTQIKERLELILASENYRVLEFFVSFCVNLKKIDSKFTFNELLSLMKNEEYRTKYDAPAAALAQILIFTNRIAEDGQTFIKKWVSPEMRKQTYDVSVFDALSRLSRSDQRNVIVTQLENRYAEISAIAHEDVEAKKNFREMRRIAYYFGYVSQGDLPEQIINDLSKKPQNDYMRHLQYHIISALIDNIDNKKHDIGFVDQFENLGEILNSSETDSDCILISDFDVLYTRVKGKHYYDEQIQKKCERKLIDLLREGIYFEQAHASGALGRRDYGSDPESVNRVVNKLIEALNESLDDISEVSSTDPNQLKAVSYIVEACCQLASKNNCSEKVAGHLEDSLKIYLEKLLDIFVAISVYNHLEVALKLVVTGIQCLKNNNKSVRRMLGLCFSTKDSLCECLIKLKQEVGEAAPKIIDIWIQKLKERSSSTEIERKLRDRFNYNGSVGQKIDFSLASLSYKGKSLMIGFFFSFRSNIYFITCRHCFFYYSDVSKPIVPTGHYNDVVFSIACLSESPLYRGKLCYPKEPCAEESFDTNAIDDLMIYQLIDCPAYLSKVIFGEEDIPNDEVQYDAVLKVFSFLEYYGKSGHWFRLTCYENVANNFFDIAPQREQHFSPDSANGCSGAPIVYDRMSNVVGMWKSSFGGNDDHIKRATSVRGVTIKAIYQILARIANEEETENE